VVDEYTRESLSDLARYRLDADATIAVLDTIATARGYPVGLGNAIQQNDLLLSVAAWGGKAAM